MGDGLLKLRHDKCKATFTFGEAEAAFYLDSLTFVHEILMLVAYFILLWSTKREV